MNAEDLAALASARGLRYIKTAVAKHVLHEDNVLRPLVKGTADDVAAYLAAAPTTEIAV